MRHVGRIHAELRAGEGGDLVAGQPGESGEAGQPLGADLYNWLKLLVGFDVIFTALALGLVDSVLVG
jgi:hypothetical protein